MVRRLPLCAFALNRGPTPTLVSLTGPVRGWGSGPPDTYQLPTNPYPETNLTCRTFLPSVAERHRAAAPNDGPFDGDASAAMS